MQTELYKTIGANEAYDIIVNALEAVMPSTLDCLVSIIINDDHRGQTSVSTAKYLFATDPEKYKAMIDTLIKHAIEVDRERKYIGGLLPAIWGEDYATKVQELNATDNNFRRIYKRVYEAGM